MSKNSVLKLTLNESDRLALKNKFTDISYDPLGADDYIHNLRRSIYHSLSSEVIDAFNQQKATNNLVSSIIIDNIPIDDVITGSPNFNQSGHEFKSGVLSENIITAFSTLMGEPYSIFFEGRELVNNLTPQKQTKFDYTGLGSEVELDFHIENAALQYIAEDDYSPLGIFFLGLRIDENVEPPKTHVSDAREALKLLSEADIEVLYGNNFYIHLPYRWRETFHHSHVSTKACPVIRGSLETPRISVAFYPDMVTPINNRAKLAFDHFHEAIKQVSSEICITPGKLVYVDNRYTLHSRSKFTPTYDDNGCPYRWVHRVFIAPSLWAFRQFHRIGDRVFLPKQINQGVECVSENLTEVA